ncbi:nuclear transport factor 2 family protein [Amycolatopsis sp. NPDC004079]|uniref:nuclear transport factor 2 family protein n=1 Tax=Amycolatopsis sp. NPDC004079 TaxID=3154549 RepID=UPI0033B6722E
MTEDKKHYTPREIFERVKSATIGKDPDYADLYAEDGAHELPFAPPGVPKRIEGREKIRAFLEAASANAPMKFTEFANVRIHDTDEPGTIICEYDLHGEVVKTGAPFVFGYVLLIHVQHGKIKLIRDYMDSLAMTTALGGLHGATKSE